MSQGDPLVLAISNLYKRFGNRLAVTDLSLQLQKGECYGLLGPNGSGKTTTLRLILGLSPASSGRIALFGFPVPGGFYSVRQRVGALVESPGFYPRLSGRKNLLLLAWSSGDRSAESRIEDLLNLTGISDRAGDRVAHYSLGMRQRLAIAAALLHDPELVLLDEPLTGLDPQGIIEMRELMRNIVASGKTILYSSHILSEAELICTRVGFLSRGQLVKEHYLKDVAQGVRVKVAREQVDEVIRVLEGRGWQAIRSGDELLIQNAERDVVRDFLADAGFSPTSVRSGQTLEELYSRTMSQDQVDANAASSQS